MGTLCAGSENLKQNGKFSRGANHCFCLSYSLLILVLRTEIELQLKTPPKTRDFGRSGQKKVKDRIRNPIFHYHLPDVRSKGLNIHPFLVYFLSHVPHQIVEKYNGT